MVVSGEPLATDAGLEVLRQGGNAFDAAVAVGFALAVTYPQAGNLGGGGFFVGLTNHGTPMALDFRETAPAAAKKDMFLDDKGDIAPSKSIESYQSVGVPGTVDGLLELQHKFGKLPLYDDMRPAIRLAKYGFKVSAALHETFVHELDRLTHKDGPGAVFYPDGAPVAEGTILIQSDLGNTLQHIAEQGRVAFYEGDIATSIAREMERLGGLITVDDLKKYRPKWREPFIFRVGDYEFITHPLPSSGGIVLDQILNLVDLKALQSAGYGSAAYVRGVTEAERLAYADRNYFLGDADFVKVPVGEITSHGYLEQRQKLIPASGAGSSKGVTHGGAEKLETTHFCATDKFGNVAAITYTLNGSYGMGAMVPGGGFFLNNEMDDFTSKPGEPNMFGLVQGDANSIQPHKRPLSSMTPTIIKRDGRFYATFGSPGGSTIITTVLQIYLNLTLFNMDIQHAIDAARFHHQWLPDQIDYEDGAFTAEALTALQGMGYTLNRKESIGIAEGIVRLPDGSFVGWSDRRGSGKAEGY
jgi:gamma-glutamyltranspeptidase/glutathione hydrolase